MAGLLLCRLEDGGILADSAVMEGANCTIIEVMVMERNGRFWTAQGSLEVWLCLFDRRSV